MALSKIPDSPVERHSLGIVATSPDATRYVTAFFRIHGPAIDALRATSAFRRLEGISQLGLKRGTRGVPASMVPFCGGRESESTALGPFDRTQHSERVCATMVAFCALHDVPFVDALYGAVGALFHDLGHPAFSHTIEPVLHRRGFPDHEETGRRIVREDPEVLAIFARHGIDAERVVAVVREEGGVGLRQKLCDTCTYLVHDSAVAGFPIDGAFAWDLLRSVAAVECDAFVANDPSVLMGLLERRLAMTADLYEHPLNRLNSLFVCEIVEWLVDNGYLEAERLVRMVDADVLVALTTALDDGAPAWVVFGADFMTRDPEAIRHWAVSEHTSEEDANDATSLSTPDRPRFLLPPINLSGKELPVRRHASDPIRIIRCSAEDRPYHHKLWYVISYVGPV